jgi:hypothetical protein
MLLDAVTFLRETHTLLRVAGVSAQSASDHLREPRSTACDKLVERIDDAIEHTARLLCVVEADLRSSLNR